MRGLAPSRPEDTLIREVRGYADAASGRGMHVTVSGEHLAAVLQRLDHLEVEARARAAATPPAAPPEPVWQEPLAQVIPVLDDIAQSKEYKDLRGVNLLDALTAWAARNGTTLDPDAISAVSRALAGG